MLYYSLDNPNYLLFPTNYQDIEISNISIYDKYRILALWIYRLNNFDLVDKIFGILIFNSYSKKFLINFKLRKWTYETSSLIQEIRHCKTLPLIPNLTYS